MNERVWHKGPPPHIGWWNASVDEDTSSWRWWDGKCWSRVATPTDAYVGSTAQVQHGMVRPIEWSAHWPENARVPRVDPSLRENRAIVEFINISITSPDPKLWEEAAWKDYHCKHTPAPAGSTRTVREMKERLKPMPTMHIPSTAPDREKVVVPRLSDAIRVGDVDFSGAMLRNSVCVATQDHRREDTPGSNKQHLRSNGQQIPDAREIGDRFHGISTMALMKEVVRRLNV